ncbi:Homologous-pairing protein 2 [Chionoecetes opilio]|uniref:Homologous-pairing protein 2 homolog n=1 Tax=Chionoecetes opilio TaxID=41210 RepID=A0A8J5BVK2_CHIOP|nr:Homologous-pairing protein 2 [Chionoecetes opilio]KAG0711078.1 Homologous-pairing protein 2 [Chionoecetes opilio]
MSKKEGSDCVKVKKYVEQQNRPYSVNDIFLNLHKEVGKTAVQKALDQLTAEGTVREKAYGKQKVYVYNQELFPPLDETQLKEMDTRTAELCTTLKEKETQLCETEGMLKQLMSTPTTQEAQKKATQIEAEVSRLQQKLSDLTENRVLVSKDERDKVVKDNDAMTKQWRKRRRIATDILDAILEGYPHPKAHLYEEVGVETDQEAGVTLPKT